MTPIEELRNATHHLPKATAKHVESMPVTEKHKGWIVWDGVVEVFDLKGHPKANRIYAWAHDTDDPKHSKRYVTVLHTPPVTSPQTAVQGVILQEFKSRAKSN